ncbi:MAG: hypothetical protein H0V01_15220 [Bacteroidetes bacterium]|nr:hypothetical protein [Bacteroidota bacterium]HET6245915.1 hypothetical protein [Bacteroidia bacterium]
MFKLKTILGAVIIFAVLFSSCSPAGRIGTHTKHSMRSASFLPNVVRLDLTMNDFEYLGTQEVSVTYNRYLGLFSFISSVNQQEYARRNVNIVNLNGNTGYRALSLNYNLMQALYVSLVNFPNADFVVPVSIVEEKQQMFLGRVITKKLKVKMYKIKEK